MVLLVSFARVPSHKTVFSVVWCSTHSRARNHTSDSCCFT